MIINKKAIKLIKSKLTKEEIELLVENIKGLNLSFKDEDIIKYDKSIHNLLYDFVWNNRKQGHFFWKIIYYRFTNNELMTKLFVEK